ncbi:aliphatic sulfonate ABC transporter ATP binding subunit [Rhodovastum atsumiense]|uniref:ABC transporter ATP-binding protein n=1 Tax=Rhodovastum atsumiense TaxID=504468 RepID=A0A5M6J0N4_9PROT|nr:ABC transporter ATP-binding protein [Rhodovastum atsumiense]KAA5614133.1 ABC transporter ATP-binding protein [Rhodovastum atsumiense]CAH2598983.1 aliphatic sulfonate ABC transporter ATP binding subunit [Rhodovastum atsumiense]
MLELAGLSMRYDMGGRPVSALDAIDLACPAGSLTTVVGRSGCGKTTLLRLIAGLQRPSAGEVRGRPDRIGYVFQEPRLMPWLKVHENVAFGLSQSLPATTRHARVSEMLEQVGLTAFADAYPSALSGGMASRVAIARALAPQPDLLLMDEPFAALDAFTRRSLQAELVQLWQQRRPTVLFITHDVEEAVLLGERVVQFSAGRLVGTHGVDLPYPRDPTDPDLLHHRRAVLARLLQDPHSQDARP